MATRTLKKSDKPTGITLFFEGTKFRATLVKFDKVRYKKVADVVEVAFRRAFGDMFAHKRGTREWSKEGADPERADQVAVYLKNFPEIISVQYDQTDRPSGPFSSVTRAVAAVKNARSKCSDRVAIEVLKQAVDGDGLGLNGAIRDAEKRINNLQEETRRAENELAGLKAKRDQILATIERLSG